MNPRHKFFNTKEIYFYYDLNHNRIIATNDQDYPALPFVCSDKKHFKTALHLEFPQHNLYYILADDGQDLNSKQRRAIKKFKSIYMPSNPTHIPLMISQQNLLELIEIFQNNLSQYQVMHILASDLNQQQI